MLVMLNLLTLPKQAKNKLLIDLLTTDLLHLAIVLNSSKINIKVNL